MLERHRCRQATRTGRRRCDQSRVVTRTPLSQQCLSSPELLSTLKRKLNSSWANCLNWNSTAIISQNCKPVGHVRSAEVESLVATVAIPPDLFRAVTRSRPMPVIDYGKVQTAEGEPSAAAGNLWKRCCIDTDISASKAGSSTQDGFFVLQEYIASPSQAVHEERRVQRSRPQLQHTAVEAALQNKRHHPKGCIRQHARYIQPGASCLSGNRYWSVKRRIFDRDKLHAYDVFKARSASTIPR